MSPKHSPTRRRFMQAVAGGMAASAAQAQDRSNTMAPQRVTLAQMLVTRDVAANLKRMSAAPRGKRAQ